MIDNNKGSLTVYAAGPASLMKTLMGDFEEQSGIRINLFQATTGRVLARLEAEAANTQADVFISASWDLAQDLDKRGWLLPYQSPNATSVPIHLKTSTYVAQAVSALGIIWNSQSQTPKPTDWQDLARDAFTGKLTMPDPSLSGASLDLLLALEHTLGEEAWDLLRSLRDRGLEITGSNDQALAQVLRGEKAAVFGSVDYVAHGAIQHGKTIEVIFPQSGTLLVPRPMMILNTTRAPEKARLLVDYLLNESSQSLTASAGLMPSRSDIATQRPSVNDISLLPQQEPSESSRQDSLARFKALFDLGNL